MSKYMVEAIPVSAISQCVIIIVNNIEMHVHLSSLEPTELVNGLASFVAAAEISCCVGQVNISKALLQEE